MTGHYKHVPHYDTSKSLVSKAPQDDVQKPALLMSVTNAPTSNMHPLPRTYAPAPQSSAVVKDDAMLDWGYAAALAALLALVLLREFFLFLPVLGSMLWRMPFVVLLGVPGVILGTCLAILWFVTFLWFVGSMGFWGVKILTGIILAVQLSTSVFSFRLFLFASSTKTEMEGTDPAGLPSALQGYAGALKELAQSASLSCVVVSLAYATLFGICLLCLHKKYTQATVGFLLDAKTFLVSRSQALLLSMALLCHGVLLVMLLLTVPLEAAMVENCIPELKHSMEQASHPNSPNAYGMDPSSTMPRGPQGTPQDPFKSLAASTAAMMHSPTCKPYLDALLPGWISGISFGVLYVILLTWMDFLLYHVIFFVSAKLGFEDKSALTLPGGNSSTSPHGMVDAAHVLSAFKHCFSRSFGSLCFSALIATLLSYAMLLIRALFLIPGVSLLAPAFDLVAAVSVVAVQLLLAGYVIPAMAILDVPLREAARRVCDLVLDNLPQVLVLEVSMLSINAVFGFLSMVCFSLPMVVIFLLTMLLGRFGDVSFRVAFSGSIISSIALAMVFHSVVCSKFVALALDGKLSNTAELNLVVSDPPSGKNRSSSDV